MATRGNGLGWLAGLGAGALVLNDLNKKQELINAQAARIGDLDYNLGQTKSDLQAARSEVAAERGSRMRYQNELQISEAERARLAATNIKLDGERSDWLAERADLLAKNTALNLEKKLLEEKVKKLEAEAAAKAKSAPAALKK
jgi:chromosome segregation ATPase